MSDKKIVNKSNSISGILARLMDERGVTVAELARATGLTPNPIYNYLAGDTRNPRRDVVKKLADYFGVSPSYLLTGEDDPIKAVPPPRRPEGRPEVEGRLFDYAWHGGSGAPDAVATEMKVFLFEKYIRTGQVAFRLDGPLNDDAAEAVYVALSKFYEGEKTQEAGDEGKQPGAVGT